MNLGEPEDKEHQLDEAKKAVDAWLLRKQKEKEQEEKKEKDKV